MHMSEGRRRVKGVEEGGEEEGRGGKRGWLQKSICKSCSSFWAQRVTLLQVLLPISAGDTSLSFLSKLYKKVSTVSPEIAQTGVGV